MSADWPLVLSLAAILVAALVIGMVLGFIQAIRGRQP